MLAKSAPLTLAEHHETADDLAIAIHHLRRVVERCRSKYPKTGKLMRALDKINPLIISGPMANVKIQLDSEFHALIDDATHQELGNIYMNLERRYIDLVKKRDVKERK